MKKIKWSSQAETTYDKAIEDILNKWNIDITKLFISDVDILLEKLKKFNHLCPKSKVRNVRKCTVSKQISLVYKIQTKQIYLVAFVFNHSGHNY